MRAVIIKKQEIEYDPACLVEARVQCRLTQEMASKLANIAEQTLCRIENGTRIREDVLQKVCDVYNKPIDSVIKSMSDPPAAGPKKRRYRRPKL